MKLISYSFIKPLGFLRKTPERYSMLMLPFRLLRYFYYEQKRKKHSVQFNPLKNTVMVYQLWYIITNPQYHTE